MAQYEPHLFISGGRYLEYVTSSTREDTNLRDQLELWEVMAAASGATGDIKNNLTKLLREVQRMKLRVEPDIRGFVTFRKTY